MTFGVTDALALQGGVFLLLSIFFFLAADSASSWQKTDRLERFGWAALGVASASALVALWLAALT